MSRSTRRRVPLSPKLPQQLNVLHAARISERDFLTAVSILVAFTEFLFTWVKDRSLGVC